MRLPGAGRRSPVLPPGKMFWLGGWVMPRSSFWIGCADFWTWNEYRLILRNVACGCRAVGNPFAPGAAMA